MIRELLEMDIYAKTQELIKKNNLRPLELKDLDKNAGPITIYFIYFGRSVYEKHIWFDKDSRRWTDGFMHFTTKKLLSNFYIKK